MLPLTKSVVNNLMLNLELLKDTIALELPLQEELPLTLLDMDLLRQPLDLPLLPTTTNAVDAKSDPLDLPVMLVMTEPQEKMDKLEKTELLESMVLKKSISPMNLVFVNVLSDPLVPPVNLETKDLEDIPETVELLVPLESLESREPLVSKDLKDLLDCLAGPETKEPQENPSPVTLPQDLLDNPDLWDLLDPQDLLEKLERLENKDLKERKENPVTLDPSVRQELQDLKAKQEKKELSGLATTVLHQEHLQGTEQVHCSSFEIAAIFLVFYFLKISNPDRKSVV